MQPDIHTSYTYACTEVHRDHEHQVVRLNHNGRGYELLTNAGEAEKYRRGEIKHATDVLATNEIWYNHVRAEKPDPMDLAEHFPNMTYDQIVDKILREGEIQVSVGEKRHQSEQKRLELIDYIHNNYVDVVTKAPVPIPKLQEW
jgi:ribosome maturation protein Sdo1